MFRNLQAEMVKVDLSSKELCRELGISYNSIRRKLNGTSDFTLTEALLIWEKFFPQSDFMTLFKKQT